MEMVLPIFILIMPLIVLLGVGLVGFGFVSGVEVIANMGLGIVAVGVCFVWLIAMVWGVVIVWGWVYV